MGVWLCLLIGYGVIAAAADADHPLSAGLGQRAGRQARCGVTMGLKKLYQIADAGLVVSTFSRSQRSPGRKLSVQLFAPIAELCHQTGLENNVG
jgi:hypothetical protein